jgi:hypothetical protein
LPTQKKKRRTLFDDRRGERYTPINCHDIPRIDGIGVLNLDASQAISAKTLIVGAAVVGAGIPPGTTVALITRNSCGDPTHVVLSAAVPNAAILAAGFNVLSPPPLTGAAFTALGNTVTFVAQDFTANGPDRKCGADISYIWTAESWLYLAVVLDLFSRRVFGWATSDRLKRDLAEEALRHALVARNPAPGLVHHSDRGSQYCSVDYQALAFSTSSTFSRCVSDTSSPLNRVLHL